MLALAGVFLILVVVEIVQGMLSEVIPVMLVVAVVVLVASGISYLSLTRRGAATFREAVFNWSVVVLAAGSVVSYLALVRRSGGATLREAVFNGSVVVLAAFATILFLIS